MPSIVRPPARTTPRLRRASAAYAETRQKERIPRPATVTQANGTTAVLSRRHTTTAVFPVPRTHKIPTFVPYGQFPDRCFRFRHGRPLRLAGAAQSPAGGVGRLLRRRAHCPYGEKPAEEVAGYIDDAVRTLLGAGTKLIVLACNTATMIAVKRLRAAYPVPFVGMEPGHQAGRGYHP